MRLAVGTARFLLFFFNFVFFITGLAIIIVAALILNEGKEITERMETGYQTVLGFLIFVGVLVTVTAFFGCCGAMRNSYCMLMTFAGILTLIFLFEFAAGIAAYVKEDDVVGAVKKAVNEMIEDYNKNNKTHDAVDAMQQNFKCCGINGTSYWHNEIPGSCCPKKDKEYVHCTEKTDGVFTDGCYDALAKWVEKNIGIIGGVGIGVAFVQILGIVLACCLSSAVKESFVA